MSEDVRVAARELARQTGMTFREASAHYQLLRSVGMTSEQAHKAVLAIGSKIDEHTRALLFTIAKVRRQAQPTRDERDRMMARIAEAAYEQGCADTADTFGASADAVPLQRLREAHVTARRSAAEAAARRAYEAMGKLPGYSYTGGPVDWDTGRPRKEGPRRDG
jgi:hypothetical protein